MPDARVVTMPPGDTLRMAPLLMFSARYTLPAPSAARPAGLLNPDARVVAVVAVNTTLAVADRLGSRRDRAATVTYPKPLPGRATLPWIETVAGSVDVNSARLEVAPPLSVLRARNGMEACPKGPNAPPPGERENVMVSTDSANELEPATCPEVALRLAVATELAAVKVPPEMLPAAGLSRLAVTDIVALGLAPSPAKLSPSLVAKPVGVP